MICGPSYAMHCFQVAVRVKASAHLRIQRGRSGLCAWLPRNSLCTGPETQVARQTRGSNPRCGYRQLTASPVKAPLYLEHTIDGCTVEKRLTSCNPCDLDFQCLRSKNAVLYETIRTGFMGFVRISHNQAPQSPSAGLCLDSRGREMISGREIRCFTLIPGVLSEGFQKPFRDEKSPKLKHGREAVIVPVVSS